MEKVISCLYRGKRWRRLFVVYIEGRDGEGYFLFIKREETEKVISCLYRGKRRRRLFLVYIEGRDGEGYFLFI